MHCVHRDIKPENVLMDTSTRTLKLCDFGLSLWLPEEQEMQPHGGNSVTGTPAFLPPEVVFSLAPVCGCLSVVLPL